MPTLEISPEVAEKIKALAEQTQSSVDEILLQLLNNYIVMVGETVVIESEKDDDTPWTEEEIEELMRPQPMTGKEMVEGGFVGGWEDKGIDDPVAWLAEQRAKRRKEKFGW